MKKNTVIVWFRQDLRLEDNPALHHAVESGASVIPVYIWSPEEEGDWVPGAASRVWLHDSLEALQKKLRTFNSRLIIGKGATLENLQELIKVSCACGVYWNRRYEPQSIDRDELIQKVLQANGIEVQTFNANLLVSPENFLNKQGGPYKVFTPFYRSAIQQLAPQAPIAAPTHIPKPSSWPKSESLDSLGLLPRIDWAQGIRRNWNSGETSANSVLNGFLRDGLQRYSDERDIPSLPSVSRLSPYLHWGEISPRQVLWKLLQHCVGIDIERETDAYIRQLYWREFAHHLLFHFPHTQDKSLRENFNRFPWSVDEKLLGAWQQGKTGYPFVDAGMRELWDTGWMHNRVRMIVASFLVKDLLQPWQSGARWFWETLVDADLANNTLGWQWVAGCGADAAPYFRIFNPVTQGKKFDPQGDYIRRWIPELENLPTQWIHEPWTADKSILKNAGIILDENYPKPIVEHGMARKRALLAYSQIR